MKDAKRHTFNLDAIRDPDVVYPNQTRGGRRRCNPLGKNPGDVWHIPKITSGRGRSSPERTAHPAQMPLELATRTVLGYSNPDDLVIDPFAGSGTTLEATIRTGRVAVGIERDPDYVETAATRLDRAFDLLG